MMPGRRSIALSEWQTSDPGRDPDLAELSLPQDAATRALVEQLRNSDMLEITELRRGIQVKAFSWVGRVFLGNLQITIRPKIPGPQLLRLLRYAYGLRDLRLLTVTSFDMERDAFQELLIAQLAAEAREILARGLHRQYVRTDDDLARPRGRIDVQSISRRGGMPVAALPCIFHTRLPDNVFNRILLAGLSMAGGLTNDISLRRELHRSVAVLEQGVTAIRLDYTALQALRRADSRLTVAYRPAVTLIELLRQSSGASMESGGVAVRLPGFLFDMNRFFQTLLSRFLAEYLPGYSIEDQHGLRGMFRYTAGQNPRGRRAPTPRPDYVVRRCGEIVAMLDAKYRDLWEEPLPRDMLYQLAIYALSRESRGIATILYPALGILPREARIEVCRFSDGVAEAQVALRPVPLQQLDHLLFGPFSSSLERTRSRQRFAEVLAFGEPV